MEPRYAEITGWGKCLPPSVLSNADLTTFLDTSDEWIRSRTGIRERRISHVPMSELGTIAAKRALACAGLEPQDIDVLIFATASADQAVPNTASKVLQNLGNNHATAFDLNAACTGFVYALQTATSLIQSAGHRRALVIGGDMLPWYVDWADRSVAVLFGDAAGAVVLEASDEPAGLLSSHTGCQSDARDILAIHGFGTTMDRFNSDGGYQIAFEGQEIFKRAVKGMNEASIKALEKAGLQNDQVNLIVPHQANLRIIEFLAKRIGAAPEQVMVNIEKYGNTSAGTIPVALCEALEQGRVKPGDNILLAAFGGGLTWGGAVLKWGQRVTPLAESNAELPPCEKTALELIAPAIERCQQIRAAHTAE